MARSSSRGGQSGLFEVVAGTGIERFQVGARVPLPGEQNHRPGARPGAGLAEQIDPGLRAEPVIDEERVVPARAHRLHPDRVVRRPVQVEPAAGNVAQEIPREYVIVLVVVDQ